MGREDLWKLLDEVKKRQSEFGHVEVKAALLRNTDKGKLLWTIYSYLIKRSKIS